MRSGYDSPMPDDSPVALITGAGSGIGRATAIDLATRGWRLVLIGRTESKLDETKSIICDRITEPVDFISTAVDLVDPDIPDAVIGGIDEFMGRLDALVNNAGEAQVSPLCETSDELLREMFRINAFAPFRLIRAAWPLFEKTKREHRGSRPCVVNVTSMATVDPFPGLAAYAAAKSAAESLVRSIRNERGDLDLRAFAVAPGAVETPLLRSSFDESMIPRESTLEPDDVAREIVRCIEGCHDAQEGAVVLVPSPASA